MAEDGEPEISMSDMLKDDEYLDAASNYLLDCLIDDATVGAFLEIHHLGRSGSLMALDGVPEDNADTSFRIVDMPNYDIFGISTAKKPIDCVCPNCERSVAASRFAPHLEKCMGMGRISSRIASRRLAKEVSHSNSNSTSASVVTAATTAAAPYMLSNAGTDDEDDTDWSADKRRKRFNQAARSNGAKKSNGK